MNLSGTLNILRLLYNVNLCKPRAVYSTFKDIPIPLNRKIKAIVLDKDNCFAYPKQNNVWPEYEEHWKKLKEHYPGHSLLIVSNTAGSNDDIDYKQARKIESVTGVTVLRHSIKKPGCYKEILKYFYKNKIITKPDEIAIVGDRLFTDIMMSNMMNSYGVWIRNGVIESKNPIIKFEQKLASILKI